jgi:hypothetical protein
MPSVLEKRPKSFGEFVALVDKCQLKAGRSLWFRGTGKSNHKLQPTLYRHGSRTGMPVLEALEKDLMMRFKQRSIPFLTRSFTDEWDWLFFKQHYGIPTRLLDWTENPFIGLYFAVMSAQFKGRIKSNAPTLSFSSEAAVWVLDPIMWNGHALRHQGFDRGVLTPNDEALQSYKPLTKFTDMNVHPVALYGAHNSPRIVAQRGVFTIFGQSTSGMEEAYANDAFPDGSLLKIVLEKTVLPEIRKSILNNGITESVVFPDLEGLAKEIKRDFLFEY